MTGLYLHIPFCSRKCPYCDFFSEQACPETLQSYPDLLIKQLSRAVESGWQGPIDTVYFGGGTPSLLSPEAVSEILHAARQAFCLEHNAEITLEANPGTVSLRSLHGYREAGVNRLSLGLQSCNEDQLQRLGRMHSRQDGLKAFHWARAAGFDNLSLDLMFALPEQTVEELEEELDRYLELSPEHLSCYGLTAEPHTPFGEQVSNGKLSLPGEDFYAEAFMLIHERLAAAGFSHYEIANYARQGSECRHNLGYWQRQPYLGVGAGAHSFRPTARGSRWEVPADLPAYRQAIRHGLEPSRCIETFDDQSALRETVYLALRTRRGVVDEELQDLFGCTLQEAFPEAVSASAQWLTINSGRWSFSPSGWLLFDRLILPFL